MKTLSFGLLSERGESGPGDPEPFETLPARTPSGFYKNERISSVDEARDERLTLEYDSLIPPLTIPPS